MTREDKRLWWEGHAEKPILALAFVFLIALILPAAEPLDPHTRMLLDKADYLIWAMLAFEYLVRVSLSENRWQFIKSHPLEFMIVAIPFLRPLRLLRLLSISVYFIKKVRSNLEKRILSLVLFVIFVILIPSCLVMFEVEHRVKGATIKTLGDAVWWSITTMTTVGYGDKYPVTTIGRVISVVVIITGVTLAGLLTAMAAAIFIGSRDVEESRDRENFDQVFARLDSLEALVRASLPVAVEPATVEPPVVTEEPPVATKEPAE